MGAQFVHDALGIVHQRLLIAQREDADLFGRKPEREIAGVMLDQKADEPFVRPQRRAMDAQRCLVRIVLVPIDQAEAFGHGEVHLVGRQCEFAADDAPDLHVDLRAVKRGFVRHFHVVDFRINQHLPDHVLGLLPEFRFVDVFLAHALRRRGAEAHDAFLDSENLEIFQVHFVHRVELGGKLLRRAINVRVVHVQRPDAHEADEFARLLVPIARAILRQAQRQIPVTARLRRKNAVMMRAVHGFEVVTLAPRIFGQHRLAGWVGSARVPRALLGVAPRSLRRPKPRITLIWFCDACIPRISANIVKFLFQIRVAAKDPVKGFLFPNWISFRPLRFAYFVRGERLYRMQNL